MKIIKSLLLVSVGFCTTTLLHAQDVQTKVSNKTEVKTPPAGDITNKPSPQPELKPMNGTAVKEAPVAAAVTPSPFTKDKSSAVKPEQPKLITPAIVTDVLTEKLTISLVPGPVVIKQQ